MEQLFKKYYKKIAHEYLVTAILKSSFCTLIALTIFSLLKYFSDNITIVSIIWTSIAVFLLAFTIFHKEPSRKDVAERIDRLGLEERLLTAEQFKNDNSFIAQKQREDTEKALKDFNETLLKFSIPSLLILLVSISFVFASASVTLDVLAETGKIKSGKEIIEDITEEKVYFEVSYSAEDGGIIDGDLFQVVEKGENANGVFAVPEDGYVFIKWSDGLTLPYREDIDVTEDISVTAYFEAVSDSEDDEQDVDDEDADQAPDAPSEESLDGEERENGEPSDDPGGGEGGQWKENDAINNGSDDYGDHFNGARGDATEGSSGLSGGQQGAIGGYFDSIAKGGN